MYSSAITRSVLGYITRNPKVALPHETVNKAYTAYDVGQYWSCRLQTPLGAGLQITKQAELISNALGVKKQIACYTLPRYPQK